MSENYAEDDEDVSFFGIVKAVTKTVAKGVGKEDDDADRIGAFVGAAASIFRTVSRS